MKQLNLHIISTEEDNTPLADGDGWLDNFTRYLKLVMERMGWKDFISFNTYTQNLESVPTETGAIILVVVSPSLLNSTYHSNYVEEFILNQGKNKSTPYQVLKIMKSAIPADSMRTELRALFQYNFYFLDFESGKLSEYKDVSEFEEDDAFWMILVDLCYDILNKSEVGIKSLGQGKSIFLAETGTDLYNERQLIRRELKRFGYQVLPKNNIKPTSAELHKQMMADLPKCLFSIHLVGKERGANAENKIAIPEFQHSIASSYAQMTSENGNQFKEVIWMQPNVHITDEQQKLFVRDLQKNANTQENIEILQMRLEEFKSVMMKSLERVSKQNVLSPNNDSINGNGSQIHTPKVYLIADRRDFFASDYLAQWVREQNMEVLQPDNTNKTTDRETHIKHLNESDANLIFYKKATKSWLVTKLQDIMKSPGLGRTKQRGPLGVFVTSLEEQKEAEQIKEVYQQYSNLQIISNTNGFPYKELSEFLGEIQQNEYAKVDS
ncbi:MAG: hypothetical protein ACI85I_000103 [Arenicella sp.]|jgi:hypothetical protein